MQQFDLVPQEEELLKSLDECIKNAKDNNEKEKWIDKKFEFIKLMQGFELEWLKLQLERQKVDDKFELERRRK